MENILIESFEKKYGKRLLLPIKFIFSEFTDIDLNIIKIIKYVEAFLNLKLNKNIKLDKIIYCFNCLYHSNKIIYDLPHVLNNVNENSKPCLHIIYGETISELVSLALYTECLDYLNSFYNEYNILKKNRNNSLELFLDRLKNINFIEKDKLVKNKINNFIKEMYILSIDISMSLFLDINDIAIKNKILKNIQSNYSIDLNIE